MPMWRMIHWSDICARVSSATISLISSTLCVPRARLWRMVEAMRFEMSFSITATGSRPRSRS